jgi:glucosamine kinase
MPCKIAEDLTSRRDGKVGQSGNFGNSTALGLSVYAHVKLDCAHVFDRETGDAGVKKIEDDVGNMLEYLIGVDGGGTGTRVRVERLDGMELGRGSAGPSGLIHGAGKAWAAVLDAVSRAFSEAGVGRPALDKLGVGLGMAGVHNPQWAAEFTESNPGFGAIAVATDAYCTLLGAHQGKPGAIIAIGTGSVGEILLPDGTRREVGGWGFPVGDEASGAWLGLQSINHVQRVFDGRRPSSDFARAVIEFCGGDSAGLFRWLAQANQTAYAQLAPLVIRYAPQDEAAHNMMVKAGQEIAEIASALDPSGLLPIALCGGLAAPMSDYLPEQLRARVVKPHADASAGALQLIRQSVKGL